MTNAAVSGNPLGRLVGYAWKCDGPRFRCATSASRAFRPIDSEQANFRVVRDLLNDPSLKSARMSSMPRIEKSLHPPGGL